jgi:hypothetical protein
MIKSTKGFTPTELLCGFSIRRVPHAASDFPAVDKFLGGIDENT